MTLFAAIAALYKNGLPMTKKMLRIKDGDILYMGWWIILIGSIIALLVKIELNTR